MKQRDFRETYRYVLLGLAIEGVAKLTPQGEARVRLISHLPETVDQLLNEMWARAHTVDDGLFRLNGEERHA